MIPVVIVQDVDQAVPLARALVAGGLPVIEVTFRTPAAADATPAIAEEVPHAVVGAGSPEPGAGGLPSSPGRAFLVTAGWTDWLMGALDAVRSARICLGSRPPRRSWRCWTRGRGDEVLPGAGGRGDAVSQGARLTTPAGPLLPTGGVNAATAPQYLALPNVGCVGGTWMLPADARLDGWATRGASSPWPGRPRHCGGDLPG
ncbi:2-dehydro-3-deoxy-phosphogluconate aldolase OS=Streptomyces antimycoticus OX=68175 GN=SSPO_069480 PE=3 SV=1 [Streptomyces antimycoticus]